MSRRTAVINQIRAFCWNGGTLAAEGISAALADPAFEQKFRVRNAARRNHLRSLLRDAGIDTYPSAANFLLLKFPPSVRPETIGADLINFEGVLARTCANFEGLSPPHLRVSVRRSADNERLVAALRRVLARRSS